MPRALALRIAFLVSMGSLLGMHCPRVIPFFDIELAGPGSSGDDYASVQATVHNAGPDPWFPVVQVDGSTEADVVAIQSAGGACSVPLGACVLPFLGAGESATVDFVVQLAPGAQDTIPITARVVSPIDPDQSDNVAVQNLDVVPANLERIEVAPENLAIAAGRKAQLVALGFYDVGPPRDLSDEVIWRVINGAGVTIDPVTGVLTALAGSSGTGATIGADLGAMSDTVDVDVRGATGQVFSVDCDDLDAKLAVGNSMQCSARLSGEGVSNLPAVANQTAFASWSCIGPAASCRDTDGSKGRVTCRQAGRVTVEAQLGDLRALWPFECVAAQRVGVQLTPPFEKTVVGGGTPFSVIEVFDGDFFDNGSAETLQVRSLPVGFVMEAAYRRVATYYQYLAEGDNTIEEASGDVASVSGTASTAIRLEGPGAIRLLAGTSQGLQATLVGDDGARSFVDAFRVGWRSEDRSIAEVTVSPIGGDRQLYVSGVAAGSTTLIATVLSGEGVLTTRVPVEVLVRESLAIVPVEGDGAPVRIPRGGGRKLRLVLTYTNGTTEDVTEDAIWSSSDPSIAAPGSKRGLVLGAETGIASISARYGTTASIAVVVEAASPTNVFVSGPSSLRVGTRGRVFVGANFDNGTFVDATGLALLKSEDETVAVASSGPADPSMVYGMQPGLVRVRASLGGTSSSQQLVVHEGTLNSLNLQPAGDMAVGEERLFSVFAIFLDGNRTFSQDLSFDGVFGSSNPDVVAVSNARGSEGAGTARSAGSATISGSWTDPNGVAQRIFLPIVVK